VSRPRGSARPPKWLPFGGNQVQPGMPPDMAQLVHQYDAVQAIQDTAEVQQNWGTSMLLLGSTPPPASVFVQPQYFPMVSIGPFPEPRSIALEQTSDLSGFIAGIMLEHRITLGIGSAVQVMLCSQVPAVLYCQSLQVETRRVDQGVGLQQYPISVWAAPHVPRANPVPFLTSIVSMGAGATSAAIPGNGPPLGATHFMVAVSDVEVTGTITVRMRISMRAYPEDNTTGAFGTKDVWVMCASQVSANVVRPGLTAAVEPSQPGNMAPAIIPIPWGQTVAWRLYRGAGVESAGAADFAVIWLRQ
jgi:hypothetical protein